MKKTNYRVFTDKELARAAYAALPDIPPDLQKEITRRFIERFTS